MNALFITATRVGDAVLSTGILDHLIRRYPGIRVTVACGAAAAPLFAAVPDLERIIVLDKMAYSLHWLKLWKASAGRYWDVLVDLRNSSMYYALLARKRYRMGRRGAMHRVKQLGRVLGLEDAPPAPRLWITETHLKESEKLIPGGGPVLALGPTANWRAKTWAPENFARLAERLRAPGGIVADARVAVFGLESERDMAARVIGAMPEGRSIDLVGRADLLTAYACLGRADLFVGNDSGLMHVAAAAGTPTLGLFGPSPDDLYAPWGEHCAVVRTRQSYTDIFPPDFDHRASGSLMDGLSVEAAGEAAEALWRRTRETGA